MKFAIMVYETESDFSDRADALKSETYWAGYTAYGTALVEGGVAAGGTALMPPGQDTVTIRHSDGKRVIQDGPYSDTKEQLGGLFVIEVASLQEAIEWAAKCPGAFSGVVEIRPVMEM